MYDYMFRNALIVDGSGNEPYRANVAIFGDRIAFIGNEGITRAKVVIDASSAVLTPGFIDMHTHTDLQVLRDRDMKAKLHQGILTDVSGNCGIGVFPNTSENLHVAVEDVLGTYENWSWKTYEDYKAILMNGGIGINEVFLASHTALRYAALGDNPGRAASGAEIETMCMILDDLLENGIRGFSSGLYYAPCLFAEEKELLALLNVVKRHDAFFAVHHRCEGNDVIPSLGEVLSLAEKTGVRLEVSHLKAIGKKNQEKVPEMLRMIETARARGLDVQADQYPYSYGSTSLFSLLPPHLLSLSRFEQRLALSLEGERDELKNEILHPDGWDSVYEMVGPDALSIIYLEHHDEYNGMSLTEIGKEKGKDPLDALFDILSEETGLAVMSDVTQSDESLKMIMKHPLVSFGTDALYSSPLPHPRSYHSTVEYLSRYVVNEHLMTLPEAVRKMTGLNADKLRLEKRGYIREGYYADLLLFRPEALNEDGDDNLGFDAVMVAGKPAYLNGRWYAERSGCVL